MTSPMARRPFVPSEGERRIAEKLKELRTRRRLTQVEVAKRIGITSRTLVRYERLERPIPTGNLLALQELLGPLGQATAAMYEGTLGSTIDAVSEALGPRARAPFISYGTDPTANAANPDEDRLLRIFRALRPEKQYTLLGFALSLEDPK